MRIGSIIDAILRREVRIIRESFANFVKLINHSGKTALSEDDIIVYLVVGVELCHALSNDVAPMPVELCRLLVMPAGSTYARGGDKLLQSRGIWAQLLRS